MSPVAGPVEEHELNAHFDRQLPPDRAAAVAAYLAARPEAQARLRQYGQQQQTLRAAITAQSAGPIPGRLRVPRLAAVQRRRRSWRLAAAAVAVMLFVLGGVGGWAARDADIGLASFPHGGAASAAARTTTAAAIEAYRVYSVEARHPVEVAAAQEAHLVQWLSKRLGRPLIVPDLGAVGFRLMGGRLLPGADGPAAQLMYENAKGARLTCYYQAVGFDGETAFRYREAKGVGAFYWSDDGFGYAITARVGRALLLKIAEIMYRQIDDAGNKSRPPPPPGKAS
ncbi:MAG TPA: anti-sigma factor [Stellaceae bacterium]|jgi:anti-sigma factor RsiW